MSSGRTRFSRSFGRIHAMAVMSFRETRGMILPALVLAGGVLFLEIGLQIPAPLESNQSLAGAFFFSAMALVLSLTAMALGAWGMAGDRVSGFHGFLLAKPVRGAVYFLGRFLGLSARLTLISAGAILLGGLILTVRAPESKFSRVEEASRFLFRGKESPPEAPVLLAPGGEGALWQFAASPDEGPEAVSLRFIFRPRYPRSKAFQPEVTLNLSVRQGDSLLIDKEIVIRNRKSFHLPFQARGSGGIQVLLTVTGGGNFMEIKGEDCSLAHGKVGAVTALLRACVAGLPLLYLSLAVALFFSSFVSIPTALFATAVLSLLTLLGPTLKAELQGMAAPQRAPSLVDTGSEVHPFPVSPPKEPGAFSRAAAKVAVSSLSLLPDLGAGGGTEPLSRMESPAPADLADPWRDSAPHLLLALVLGCFVAGRRRS